MSDLPPMRDRTYHAAWRGYRYFGLYLPFEQIAGWADNRGFEVIERRPDLGVKDQSRYWVRDTECPACRNTRWREIAERPQSLDHVHPYDMNGWAGTDLVTAEQWQSTTELMRQAEQGGLDVFAYEWPPPWRRGSYRVFRGDEPIRGYGGFDLREAIGLANYRGADRIVDLADPECPPWTRGEPCEVCGADRWEHGSPGQVC